jgi:hypothetical protein
MSNNQTKDRQAIWMDNIKNIKLVQIVKKEIWVFGTIANGAHS